MDGSRWGARERHLLGLPGRRQRWRLGYLSAHWPWVTASAESGSPGAPGGEGTLSVQGPGRSKDE